MGNDLGIGMNHWEWEGMGIIKSFPPISTHNYNEHIVFGVKDYPVLSHCNTASFFHKL